MLLDESAIQSFITPLNFKDLDLLPDWHKYYQYLDNFLNNNISLNINSLATNSNGLAVPMGESEDNKNKRKSASILSDWMNSSLERVNHSNNFEEYTCSSHGTKLLYNNHKSDTDSVSKQFHDSNKDSFSHPFNQSSNKSLKSSYLADQRDHLFAESCLSAGNSSSDVTPSGTPQSSPHSIRKIMDSNNKMKAVKNEKNSTVSSNTKRWFYSGFFLTGDNVEQKSIDKPRDQMPKTPSFKNLSISNFDINAVGPTSW